MLFRHRGGRGIAILILNLSARWRWVINTMPWPFFHWERAPIPFVQNADWAKGLVLVGLDKRRYLVPPWVMNFFRKW